MLAASQSCAIDCGERPTFSKSSLKSLFEIMRLPSQIARLNAITRFHPSKPSPGFPLTDGKPGRAFEICPFKCPTPHSLRKCRHFLALKELCTKTNYISSELNPVDADGFCAAGIIPYCRKNGTIYLFMLIEERRFISAANFVGGGRETIRIREPDKETKLRCESYLETAVSEFCEEVGDLIGVDHEFVTTVKTKLSTHRGPVLWTGKSKYVGIPIEVSPDFMDTVQLQMTIVPKSEAQNFEWINLNSIHEVTIHGFTMSMLQFVFDNSDSFFVQ